MATTDDQDGRGGLGRSLEALFARHRPSEEPGSPADGLDGLVTAYLASSDACDSALAARIATAADHLQADGRPEPVADAVLRLATNDPEEGRRALARELTTPAVARRLADRLGAVRDGERRAELTDAVGRLGPIMAEALAEDLARTESRSARHAFTEALARIGEEASAVLASMVRDPRWFVVRNAVLVLGGTGGSWVLPHLTRTLGHPDPRVRRETLMALARIGGEGASNLVPGLLDDPDPRVREAAALASGAVGARSAAEPLLARLRSGDEPAVEAAALRALGRLGDEEAVPELARKAGGSFLGRVPVEVRVAAYRALAAVGTPEARRAVREGLHDRDATIRVVVEELLSGR